MLWGLGGAIWGLTAKVQLIPDSIKLGESTLLRLTVSGKGVESLSNVAAPNLSGFEIGPSTEETTFSQVGRQLIAQRWWQYTLKPLRAGSFNIPPFVIVHQGQVLKTKPLNLLVVEPVNPKLGRIQGVISLRSRVSSKRVVVGEPIQYELIAYSDRPLEAGYVVTPPQLDDFITVGVPTQSTQANRTDSGVVVPLRQRVIAPTRTGVLTIPNATIVIQFQGQAINHVAVADPIEIEVLPLPPPPPHFTGALGEFKLRWEESPGTVRLNTPFLIRIAITGWGNTLGLTGVNVPTSTQYQVMNHSILPHSNGWAHTNVVYELMPTQVGRMAVEGVSLTAYSTQRQRFYTIMLPPLFIKVEAYKGPILPYSPAFKGPLPTSRDWMKVAMGIVGGSFLLMGLSELALWRHRRKRYRSQFKELRGSILTQLAILTTRPATPSDVQWLQQQVLVAIQCKMGVSIIGLLPVQLMGVLVDHTNDHDWIDLILEWFDCMDTVAFSGEQVSPDVVKQLIQLTRKLMKKLDRWGH